MQAVPRAAMPCAQKRRTAMSISLILLIVIILLLVGALPAWPYSSGWGYWPSGGLGLIFVNRYDICARGTPLNVSGGVAPPRHQRIFSWNVSKFHKTRGPIRPRLLLDTNTPANGEEGEH